MSIFVNASTRLVVQGITGRDGSFHARQMKEYGTRVVAGVTPGKGGTNLDGIPVFDSVEEAVARTKANVSVIYVPAALAQDAIYEAVDAVPKLVETLNGLSVKLGDLPFDRVVAEARDLVGSVDKLISTPEMAAVFAEVKGAIEDAISEGHGPLSDADYMACACIAIARLRSPAFTACRRSWISPGITDAKPTSAPSIPWTIEASRYSSWQVNSALAGATARIA